MASYTTKILIGGQDLYPDIVRKAGTAVEGLNGNWLAGLLAASLLVFTGAWLLFLRRDIRVGGERSWKLPGLRARR